MYLNLAYGNHNVLSKESLNLERRYAFNQLHKNTYMLGTSTWHWLQNNAKSKFWL